MPLKHFIASIGQSISGAWAIIKDTIKVLGRHPEITIYFYAAASFIFITLPLVSSTLVAHWYNRLFSETEAVPHKARLLLGVVGFSAFYVALVTAYFTSAASISVIAKLEDRQVPPFYGLLRVVKNFFKLTKFALLSIFFLPVGFMVQRKKLPGGFFKVLGSSLTLHMAQVAPAVLTTNKRFSDTIRDSIDTLGQAWRESLVLKIAMYLIVFLVIALPKLIQQGFFSSPAAGSVGWVISIELGASSLAAFKILNSVFTAVLYHHAQTKEKYSSR